jgi:hypothetical protein
MTLWHFARISPADVERLAADLAPASAIASSALRRDLLALEPRYVEALTHVLAVLRPEDAAALEVLGRQPPHVLSIRQVRRIAGQLAFLSARRLGTQLCAGLLAGEDPKAVSTHVSGLSAWIRDTALFRKGVVATLDQ